jgi:hypothetical protein
MPRKEDVLVLLREAAELEHQLMIQYLFAAYSLKTEPDEFTGAPDPHGAARTGAGWRDRILAIAREEMGHLITVQQVFLSLGGAPHFDRDSFPISPHFYPFAYMLEPLTTKSLAKYLWSEKPQEDATLPRDLLLGHDRAQIETEVYPHQPNELGILYEAILHGLELLPDEAFDADVSTQTDLSRWPGLGRLAIVDWIPNRDAARAAVEQIVRQGEGHLSSKEESHFQRFLELYREFRAAVTEGIDPARNVAIDPNTADPDRTGHDMRRYRVLEPGRITAQPALAWARLFNKRYAVLLANLTHALTLPSASPAGPRPSPRDPKAGEMAKSAYDGLTVRKFAALTTAQIATLSPEQIGNLRVALIEAMTEGQLKALDIVQLKALTSDQVLALSANAVEALDPARLEWLGTPALDALTGTRRAELSEAQRAVAALVKRNREQLEMLIRWSRDEMTLALAPLARHLTHLPINDQPNAPRAGAPFELDSTGPSLPDDEKSRWCAHQRLIDETRLLIAAFPQPVDDPLGLISAIQAIDRVRADFIAQQLTRVTQESRDEADAIAGRIDKEWKEHNAQGRR